MLLAVCFSVLRSVVTIEVIIHSAAEADAELFAKILSAVGGLQLECT